MAAESENITDGQVKKRMATFLLKGVVKGVGFFFFLVGLAVILVVLRLAFLVAVVVPHDRAYERTGDNWDLSEETTFEPSVLVFRKSDDVTDETLRALGGRQDVWAIYLLGCPDITDESVELLSHIPNLRRIVLDGCEQLDEPDFSKLSRLKSLTRLSVQNCSGLKDCSFSKIAQLRSLKILQATGCSRVTPAGVAPLASLPLVEFAPPECMITDETIAGLTKFRRLRGLTLAAEKDEVLPLTDEGISTLSKLKKLYCLQLDNCPNVSESSLTELRRNIDSKRSSIYYPELRVTQGRRTIFGKDVLTRSIRNL